MKIGTIVYLTEPLKWRKTPDGDWDEYPIGTPLRVIGDSGMRGPDLEFIENGIQIGECAFVKFSTENPIKRMYKIIITETNTNTLESTKTTYEIPNEEELVAFWKKNLYPSYPSTGVSSGANTNKKCYMQSYFKDNVAINILQIEL